MKHFTLAEFACKCGHCDGGTMDPALLRILDDVREDWGQPLTVTSGYRCHFHNSEIGGAKHSHHMTGNAVDFLAQGNAFRNWLTPLLAHYGLWMEAGTVGWIHCQNIPAGSRVFNP